MKTDIREQAYICHEDIVGLNFIRSPGVFVFRKYHKQGLRSQIMEVLDPGDVEKQNSGEMINGVRTFPWARPIKILRIFRTKFETPDEIFDEIKRLKIIENYLPPDSYAKSHEFIVDYQRGGIRDVLLCGLQDFVEGEVLNPWSLAQKDYLTDLVDNMETQARNPMEANPEPLLGRIREKAKIFLDCVKSLILKANYVPDFAGVGNLILTPDGNIKLVDINNISRVSFGSDIILDNKGYPVCDKSIEAVSILEERLLNRSIDKTERLYSLFLEPKRMKAVKDLEERFHDTMKLWEHYPKRSLT